MPAVPVSSWSSDPWGSPPPFRFPDLRADGSVPLARLVGPLVADLAPLGWQAVDGHRSLVAVCGVATSTDVLLAASVALLREAARSLLDLDSSGAVNCPPTAEE